jgi:hypothetical protein
MSDRITDNTGLFYARLRAESPRAQRLRAEQIQRAAELAELGRALLGGLMLALIFVVFAVL